MLMLCQCRPLGHQWRCAARPGHEQHALLSMLKYAKIKAVAVREDARGRGIGVGQLKRYVQVYWQLDDGRDRFISRRSHSPT